MEEGGATKRRKLGWDEYPLSNKEKCFPTVGVNLVLSLPNDPFPDGVLSIVLEYYGQSEPRASYAYRWRDAAGFQTLHTFPSRRFALIYALAETPKSHNICAIFDKLIELKSIEERVEHLMKLNEDQLCAYKDAVEEGVLDENRDEIPLDLCKIINHHNLHPFNLTMQLKNETVSWPSAIPHHK